MTMSGALILAMAGFKISREVSFARMNGECGDMVSRAEAYTASLDDGLMRIHRRVDGGLGSTIELVRESLFFFGTAMCSVHLYSFKMGPTHPAYMSTVSGDTDSKVNRRK
jgi:hypothetical protein